MAGRIREVIDQILDKRGGTDEIRRRTTATKLILKGIDSARYDRSSPDDPAILDRLRAIVRDMNLDIAI